MRLRFQVFDASSSIMCSWLAGIPGGPVVGGGALFADVSAITTFIGTEAGRPESSTRWPASPPAARITLARPLWPRS